MNLGLRMVIKKLLIILKNSPPFSLLSVREEFPTPPPDAVKVFNFPLLQLALNMSDFGDQKSKKGFCISNFIQNYSIKVIRFRLPN